MKNIFIAGLFMMMAGSAMASQTENAFVLEPLRYGDYYTEPCPTEPNAPVPANGYCSEGMVCPGGYEALPKICFSGGIHQCGVVCKTIYTGFH